MPTDAAGQAFLAQKAQEPGVIARPSGLLYEYVEHGYGNAHPLGDTPCDFHYRGTLIDGREFDSSYKRGKPSEFTANGVVPGCSEGYQLMVEGDKVRMYIPSELAYGDEGVGDGLVPPCAVLVFDVHLVKIKGPTRPADVAQTQQQAYVQAQPEAYIQPQVFAQEAVQPQGVVAAVGALTPVSPEEFQRIRAANSHVATIALYGDEQREVAEEDVHRAVQAASKYAQPAQPTIRPLPQQHSYVPVATPGFAQPQPRVQPQPVQAAQPQAVARPQVRAQPQVYAQPQMYAQPQVYAHPQTAMPQQMLAHPQGYAPVASFPQYGQPQAYAQPHMMPAYRTQ
eukprot:TRINITY_DN63962_c0_g1_i1.p1 TRINITY_DN63962_c0_g1~~TRINITY_DN63962_c0_g1_i1.p1  ORF type:complete len:339 (-),score=56.09 TRINITY_DN63962_c0_g1_i1:123-1139(-)